VRAILQEILVQATEADLEPSEVQDTIFFMNNWMAELDADGVNLGYTIITSLSQTITIPNGAINGVIKNVAVQIAPQFDAAVVTNDLIRQARKSLKTLTYHWSVNSRYSQPKGLHPLQQWESR